MKKLLLLLAMVICINAGAQVVPVITTTLTPGSGDFLVDKSHYPFDALILNIVAKDTSKVGLNYTFTGGSYITAKPRVKFIDGRTGLPFVSIGRLKEFYDSFMVSPPFITTIAGDLNILGDATAVKQDTGNARLSRMLTNQTTGNTSLGSIDTKLSSQSTATNQTTTIARLDSIAKWQTNEGITATILGAADTLVIPAGSLLVGGVLTASATLITAADITGETKTEQYMLAGLPTFPMQAFKASATVHTITATSPCTVFVLKLH